MGGGTKAVGCVPKWRREQSGVGAPPCCESKHGRDGKGKHFKENKECLVTRTGGHLKLWFQENGGLARCQLPGCLMGESFQGFHRFIVDC